jgi:hypothetical protein
MKQNVFKTFQFVRICLYVYLSVDLSFYQSTLLYVYFPLCVYVHLSIGFVCASVCLICLSAMSCLLDVFVKSFLCVRLSCLSFPLSFCISVDLSFCQSTPLYVCMPLCMYVHLSFGLVCPLVCLLCLSAMSCLLDVCAKSFLCVVCLVSLSRFLRHVCLLTMYFLLV